MIRTAELTKRYGGILALDRLSLEIPEGSVFGLLGPNGAGKTTFLRLVMGFAFPDQGLVDRGGLPPYQIGYLPERAYYPPRFTVQDYVTTLGRIGGIGKEALAESAPRLLEQFGLQGVAGRRIGACSRGMLQRLGVVQVLLGDPHVILLDEPVLGLDPAAQKFMREQIVALHQAGKTVVLASHHLDEVTRTCTHIAVLNRGQLARTGPLEDILTPHPQVTITTSRIPDDLQAGLACLSEGVLASDTQVTLEGTDVAYKSDVLLTLLDAGVDIRHLSESHATLEEVYLEVTHG